MSNQQDHHNSGGLLALLGSIVFVFSFFLYVVVIHPGVDLGENIQEPAVPGAPTFDLSAVKEPWVSSEEIVQAGKKLYQQNCAMCHGANGDLVGGIPNARNLVEGGWKMPGIIGSYKVLQQGIAGTQMAAFKQLSTHERWAMVHFIQSITKDKSKDKPEDVAAFAATAD